MAHLEESRRYAHGRPTWSIPGLPYISPQPSVGIGDNSLDYAAYLAARVPSDIEEEALLHGKDLHEELRRVGTSKNRTAYQPTSAKGKHFLRMVS
jgi:hypothetical protein